MTDLSAAIGRSATAALISLFGGRRMRVPRAIVRGEPLHLLLGDGARDLVRTYPGRTIEIPTAREWRRREILLLRSRGLPIVAIANAVGLRTRRVQQILAESREAA